MSYTRGRYALNGRIMCYRLAYLYVSSSITCSWLVYLFVPDSVSHVFLLYRFGLSTRLCLPFCLTLTFYSSSTRLQSRYS